MSDTGNLFSFLWLDGIFDEDTVNSFSTISPASNFWQRGFVDALQMLGHNVDVIGYPVERVWPFGRLVISVRLASLSIGLTGKVVGYVNFPFFRKFVQYFNFLKAVKDHLHASNYRTDYQIVFSCLHKSTDETPSIRIAKYIRKKFGIPWICIVADGSAPPGADGYVYLAWTYYISEAALIPSIYLDGGIPVIKDRIDQLCVVNKFASVKSLMYMGDLGPHGGVLQLARSFHKLADKDIQLWICGRGSNPELMRLADVDHRIIIKGFVGEAELSRLAAAAFAFANPRPNSFVPNKLNYPSKLLHYLAYGKPIISTFTDGVSPDYADVLVLVREENDDCLGEAILRVFNMNKKEYNDMRDRIVKFNQLHTWSSQVNRFIAWL